MSDTPILAPVSPVEATATSRDQFLGGLVEALQPRGRRHRSGLDAVILAASLPAGLGGRLFDLGAGVGVAGLCAAARLADITVTLVERDPLHVSLAGETLRLDANAGFAARLRILEADVAARGRTRAAQGLEPGCADHVIMNPPYYAPGRHRASPDADRAGAHMLTETGLEPWLRTASDLLVEGGSVTVIFRADGLEELLGAMKGRFGGILIYPLFPRPGHSASRILVRGTRGSRAPLVLRPGLVLHGEKGNRFTDEVDAILRHGADLDIEG